MHWTFFAPELSATSSMERGWIMLGHATEDRADPPALLLRHGARLFDQHAIAHLGLVAFVVRLQLLGHADDALVLGVPVHPLDLDHPRLLHGVTDDDAFLG